MVDFARVLKTHTQFLLARDGPALISRPERDLQNAEH